MSADYFGFNTTQAMTLQRLMNSGDAGLAALAASVTAQGTAIANLNAWATALATKLNADAGVTDTNYDTNPQA